MKRHSYLLSLLGILVVSTATRAQVAPDKADTTFTVADGLEFKLWASEPLFVNPTCMDIDHKGRVWVCESVNYRNKLRGFTKLTRPEGDRIVILEDSKGTGHADKAVTFYQSPELLAPLGIAVAKDPVGPGYKVFVCQSPDILVFEDKDGDGKADGPPKKLLTGFGGIDHDHGVHGILIGPDMRLYFSVGDQGVHGLQSSDGKGRKWQSNDTDCRAGTIWRCDLDGKNLELIAHNFRNEYEPCVDSFGTVFVSDNDDDGNQQTRICYVMPGGDYGYHPRGPGQTHWHEEQPGVVPKILRTYFGSPTGMCVYEGTLLPKKYQGQLLHTDAGPRHLRCYHLQEKGAGYDVEREDMVTSADNWFRPSDVCVAPDGSVFVADWYDPGVGGHGMGDITRGRIFRLAPKGHKSVVPKVDLESDKGILEALGSPNLAVRYMAMAKLSAMKSADASSVLAPALGDNVRPNLRARALWQVARLIEPNLKVGTNLLPGFEAAGVGARDLVSVHIRAVRDLSRARDVEFAGRLNYWARNNEAAIRREVLLALRDQPAETSKPLIIELAKRYDGSDRFYLEAIGIAVGKYDAKRREIILADFDKEFPEWNDKVADLVWELRPPKVLATLDKRLSDPKLTAAQRGRILDIIAGGDDEATGKTLLAALSGDLPPEVRARALENLTQFLPNKWARLRSSPELRKAVTTLLAAPATVPVGLALITAAEKADAVPQVVALASSADAAIRKSAVQTLGRLPSVAAVEALKGLMGDKVAGAEAVQALGQAARDDGKRPGATEALKALQASLLDKAVSQESREMILSGLAGARSGTQWLLALKAKGELDPALQPATARLLRNSPYPDLRNKAMIAFPPPGKLDPKKLPSLAQLAGRRGDAAHGQKLLAVSMTGDLQCLKCHAVLGRGGAIGPDLSMIGKKASRENLFESILYPSKAVADQYVQWVIETKQGLSLSGLIVEETPATVTLRDGNGKDSKIDKKDIETREKSPKSLMPEDVCVYMTEDELIDLVEYLVTLKSPALGFDYWHIAGPFDNGAGDEGMDRVFPPEKNIDLEATYAGKSGKVTWRTVKTDPQGYVDLAAFFGQESENIVSYLTRTVDSPVDQEVTILLGADDASMLWIGPQLIHSARDHNAAAPGQYLVKGHLRKGTNRIVLKINNGGNPHGFYFTLLAEQEVKRVEGSQAK